MQHTSHTIESVWAILGSCTKNLSECMELLLELWLRYNDFLRFNTPREDSLESQYFLTKNRCTIFPQTSPRCLFNYSAKGGAYIGRRVFINWLFTCTDSPMVEAQKLIYHIYQVEIERKEKGKGELFDLMAQGLGQYLGEGNSWREYRNLHGNFMSVHISPIMLL